MMRLMRCAAVAAFTVLLLAGGRPAVAEMQLHLTAPVVQVLLQRDWDGLRRQLMSGTSPNTRDTDGQPLLVIAARRGLTPAVPILLDQGAHIDQPDDFGNTALIWAADQGYEGMVRDLLAAGADINHANREGVTALMRAAKADWPQVVRLLLDEGADPELTDYTGRGPLAWARDNGARSAARVLEQAGVRD